MRSLLTFTFLACTVFAQAPFEVATVRPFDPAKLEPGMSTRTDFSGLQIRLGAYTLKGLVKFAYELEDFQLSDGPSWFDRDRFDVNAKAPDGGDTGMAATRTRLRALLSDRFKLSTHTETKQVTVLVLTINKGGPSLRAGEGPPGSSSGPGSIRVRNGQVSILAQALSSLLRQRVVDRTELDGSYDYELKWAPDLSTSDGPSVFTALQEQLGLRLDSEKGPLEVLIVDGAERPTEN